MKINAVKLMRDARDRISRETSGMTPAERIEYFREGSRRFEALMEKETREMEARREAAEDPEPSEIPSAGGPTPVSAAVSAKSGSEPY